MATRRPQSQSPADPSTSIETKPSASDVSPVVPKHVIYKLLGFTVAMITTPVGMYFVTVDFGGSATVGGITAAITANVVLFTYIWVAWQDDKEEREALAGKKEKKAQ